MEIRKFGTIRFDSYPEIADIIVDGNILINEEKSIKTPATVQLIEGKHNITYRLCGYPDKNFEIDVLPEVLGNVHKNLIDLYNPEFLNFMKNSGYDAHTLEDYKDSPDRYQEAFDIYRHEVGLITESWFDNLKTLRSFCDFLNILEKEKEISLDENLNILHNIFAYNYVWNLYKKEYLDEDVDIGLLEDLDIDKRIIQEFQELNQDRKKDVIKKIGKVLNIVK